MVRTKVGGISLVLLLILGTPQAWALFSGPTTPPPASGPSAPAPLPTQVELQKLLDDGQYQDALKAASRVLALSGESAKVYDRPSVLMIKAEALLQLKQTQPALDTYALVKKDAKTPNDAAMAVAMETLIKRSRLFVYTPLNAPKTGLKPDPINILDRAKRPAALGALWVDELVAYRAKVRPFAQVTALPALLDGLAALGNLRLLELAATGADTQTQILLTEATGRAKTLLTAALNEKSQQVATIKAAANQWLPHKVLTPDPRDPRRTVERIDGYQRQGLTPAQAGLLRDVSTFCDKALPATRDFAARAPSDAEAFTALGASVTALKTEANAVLTADYTGIAPTPKPR